MRNRSTPTAAWQVLNGMCFSLLYRQSHVAALSLAFECTPSRVGLVQRQCTETSIPSSTVPNVWSSYSSASLAQARCVRHFSESSVSCPLRARYDNPHSASQDSTCITRASLLNDMTMTLPVSLHSQKPFRNTSRRSGGATKTSLVIVAESRKQADHPSGKAFPPALIEPTSIPRELGPVV